MPAREVILAVLLAVAGVCIVVGASAVSVPLGWTVGGLLLAGWSLVVFGDVT